MIDIHTMAYYLRGVIIIIYGEGDSMSKKIFVISTFCLLAVFVNSSFALNSSLLELRASGTKLKFALGELYGEGIPLKLSIVCSQGRANDLSIFDTKDNKISTFRINNCGHCNLAKLYLTLATENKPTYMIFNVENGEFV